MQALAMLIVGVSLACKDDLHGPVRIRQQAGEPIGVAQEEGGTLVRDESTDESNRQGVGIEEVFDAVERCLVGTAVCQQRSSPRTSRREPRSSTTARVMRSPSMKWSGSRFSFGLSSVNKGTRT